MKKFLAILLTLAMLLSLAACGGGETPTEPKTDEKVETPKDDNTPAKKEMTVWIEKIFSDEANQYIYERVMQYGEENGISMTCELVAVTDFVTKLNAAIEAGVGIPDVISADATRLINYYPNIPCVDVGVPVLSMHSARELMACEDQSALCALSMSLFQNL